MPSTAPTLHARLSNFVEWIAPDPSGRDEIKGRAANIRQAIRGQAEADGLTIRSTPDSGSFATRSGLRRHMRGHAEVEGQDVDLPFVVSSKNKEEEQLSVLLPRFDGYAQASYPDTARETTKSSVKLKFSDNVHFDLVPMFGTADPERQILVRSDGERRETSVQGHVKFTKSRTATSHAVAGRVKFNEMQRLLKWWRCFREDDARVLTSMPSFLINLLAAHAFDSRGVQATYGETIADWFGFLARVVRQRASVSFGATKPAGTVTWLVQDPVNATNNVVDKWSGLMCDELADWLEEGRDAMYEAITAFNGGRENDGLECLVSVFGTPIRHHSEARP